MSTSAEFCRYLLLPDSLRAKESDAEMFDTFLGEAQSVFALRMLAEDRYAENPWLAKQADAALPLDWDSAAEVLFPTAELPRAGIETWLAKRLILVLRQLQDDLRRELSRDRELVQLSNVRQIDASCLRWISRQPGDSVAVKAGPRQRVLGVVRKVGFDTLENRVLKELLFRAERLVSGWLAHYGKQNSPTVETVKTFHRLCRVFLDSDALKDIRRLPDVPVPNYVLQQENRYRKIWEAYLRLIRNFRLMEQLWNRKEEIHALLERLRCTCKDYQDRPFATEVWICPITGTGPLTEPLTEFRSLTPKMPPPPQPEPSDLRVVDLLGLRWDDVLLMPDIDLHPNAKPRVVNYSRPYTDFDPNRAKEFRHRALFVSELLKSVSDSAQAASSSATRQTETSVILEDFLPPAAKTAAGDRKTTVSLTDYFEQLHGLIGGKRWIILIADSWAPAFQEAILSAATRILGSRRNVRLLWRTVAYALGQKTAPTEVACDRLEILKADTARFTYRYENGNKILVHKAYTNHPGIYSTATLATSNTRKMTLFLEPSQTVTPKMRAWMDLLDDGARWVDGCIRSGITPYYDGLDGLYLAVQQASQDVVFKTLVQPDDVPAGTVYKGDEIKDFFLEADSDELRLFMLGADSPDETAPLKLFGYTFQRKTQAKERLTLWANAHPGQGFVRLGVAMPSMKEPQMLELSHLPTAHIKDLKNPKAFTGLRPYNDVTLQILNRIDSRSFPPASPKVMAMDDTPWGTLAAIKDYLQHPDHKPDSDLFAQAKYRYPTPAPLPDGVSPLERQRRINVFGAEDGCRTPPFAQDINYTLFFSQLARDAQRELQAGNPLNYGCVRIAAWSYQYDNPLFDNVRDTAIEKLEKGGSDIVLVTLCANLCSRPNEWQRLWKNCCSYISAYSASDSGTKIIGLASRERLLYNLLMFWPKFLENVYWTPKMAQRLVVNLTQRIQSNGIGNTQQAACFRCLLYLLRIRRYGYPRFCTQQSEPNLYRAVRGVCRKQTGSPNISALQDCLWDYLNGNGNVNGIPQE